MSLLQNPMHPGEVLKELYLASFEKSAIALVKRSGVRHDTSLLDEYAGQSWSGRSAQDDRRFWDRAIDCCMIFV